MFASPRLRTAALLAAVFAVVAPAFARADDPKPAAKPAADVMVPYRLTDTKHVMVRVKVNGKGPFNLILDTGAPAVFLAKRAATDAGVEVDDDGWAKTDSFELEGGLKVAGAKVRAADLFQLQGMNGMGLAGVELHGVVGYNVLAKYRITYDFTLDKLRFTPLDFTPPGVKARGKDNSQGGLDALGPLMKVMAAFMGIKPDFTVAPRGSLGVEWAESSGQVKIERVLAGSPAAEAGFLPGDRVESVALSKPGKVKLSSAEDIDSPADLARLMAAVRPDQKAEFKVRRGDKSVTLTVTFGKGL